METSEREEIQETLAKFFRDNNLDQVYGVIKDKHHLKNGCDVRFVTFCRVHALDGVVTIYGPNFLQIDVNHFGRRETRSFRTVEEVMNFVRREYLYEQ